MLMKRLAVLPLALSMAFAAQVATAAANIKYLIIAENGKQIGEQAVERQDDGLTKVRFIFKNNGRGPELTEQFRMGADGVMTEYSVKGNSTFGAVLSSSKIMSVRMAFNPLIPWVSSSSSCSTSPLSIPSLCRYSKNSMYSSSSLCCE